tara:strand:+ start:850 stop:1566 length:717 start_codon:yes stop_codon:yes gene_type:complete
MSDYTIAVAWSGKDALSDSDSAKVISGDDFDTEFTTVRTAVNSKADLVNATQDVTLRNATIGGTCDITGVATGPTQSAGNNTTRLATTAFVTTAVNTLSAAAYPVGAIFTTTVAYADSAAVVAAIGGTTWAAFGAGKVLIGLDSGDTDFDTASETGGSKTASGTTGSHTLTTSEIPSHSHSITTGSGGGGSCQASPGSSSECGSASTTTAGGGGGHTHTVANSIVQPYIVVYFWKRTA